MEMGAAGGPLAWLLIALVMMECVLGGVLHHHVSDVKVPAVISPQANTRMDPRESQHRQTVQIPLTWKFPVMPEVRPESRFEGWEPVPAESVVAKCSETGIRVEVKQDLQGNAQLVHPADLSLGGCEAVQVDAPSQLIIYQSDLHACGSQQMLTEDSLVYTFTLIYEPSALAYTNIVKTSPAMTYVQCYYPRMQNVSSSGVMPAWMPHTSTKVASELLYFSLHLMTADWKLRRPSHQFFVGEVMNIEASVKQFHHVPLRLYVDYCVATLEPDINAEPRYAFIHNLGCLVHSKLPDSRSQFLPRERDDKLNIQLESVQFKQRSDDSIYVVCTMRAIPVHVSTASSGEFKACSFLETWRSADGNDDACQCCDTNCISYRMNRGPVLEGQGILGPIQIKAQLGAP